MHMFIFSDVAILVTYHDFDWNLLFMGMKFEYFNLMRFPNG